MIPVPAAAAPIAAAVISKKRRQIIRAFRDAGATSPESSKTLEEAGLRAGMLVEIQKLRGVLVESSENRFFLDEERERQVTRFRRYLAASIAAVSVVLVLVAWWLSSG
jgi:hypothetical protein